MAITTPQQEYKKLRSYLNPYIKGPNIQALLTAMGSAFSSYLVNSASSVNDQLYIVTAEGVYLDQRLADYGISRPAGIGIADEEFSQIGIQIKNRKQVRDLLNNLLDIIFGDTYVRASSDAGAMEPYNLTNGDTLVVNFDAANTVSIIFNTSNFVDIAAATAQEVADVITKTINSMGLRGIAVVGNNGSGNFVQLLSNTIGPASSVTVLGGSAQDQLLFASIVAAGGNASTQWTISLPRADIVRFTWSGGANPQLGKIVPNDYVNIFGGGFTSSSNEGSFTIIDAVGGPVNISYFEIHNALATSGIVTQGIDDAMLFFNPVKKVLADLRYYAAVYQVETNKLQIFLPATTKVVINSRIGTAHIHDPQNIVYTFNANPNVGDVFHITTATSLTAGVDFAVGLTIPETIANMIATIGSISGLDPVAGQNPIKSPNSLGQYAFNVSSENATVGAVYAINGQNFTVTGTISLGSSLVTVGSGIAPPSTGTLTLVSGTGSATITYSSYVFSGVNILTIWQDDPSLTITGTYTGSANVVATVQGDPISVQPNQPGPYTYDLGQPFTVSNIGTTLTQNLDATYPRVFTVKNATQFPNSPGYLIFGYGTEQQEGPVPYIATPSDNTLLLSPAYTLQNSHVIGEEVSLVSLRSQAVITQDGLDYPFYLTDEVGGRVYAEELVNTVVAAGITVVFNIIYPGDIGLGKFGTKYSEISIVYGENQYGPANVAETT